VIASLFALVAILLTAYNTNAKSQALEADIQKLDNQKKDLSKRASELREALGPQELLQLNAAHALVDRKKFSWTGLFSDLEGVMPGSVHVTRIAVRDVVSTAGRTTADLDLTVVGKSTDDVMQMISDMDRGGIFHAELQSENPQKGRIETVTEFTLIVQYWPRSSAPVSNREAKSAAPQLSASNATAEVRQ